MELRGKVILITRAASQSGELRDRLTAIGAQVLECPTIQIVSPEDWAQIDRSISILGSYHWLLLTSANAVEQFMSRLETLGVKCAAQIAVVGSATAASLARWNLQACLIPKDYRAEGVLEAFPSDMKGVRILFPRAASARELLPEELRKRGATVDVLPVYRTVRASGLESTLETLKKHKPDCAVFTSPSTVRFLDEAFDGQLKSVLNGAAIAVIGPVTRDAAESAGLHPTIEPEHATIADLVESIREHYASHSGGDS
jgi:uroporphyrinogen-III synthase